METVTRSNAEKRAAVIALLTDQPKLSAAEIARRAKVSRNFVNGIRNNPPFCGNAEDYRAFRHKTGKTCVMRVDTIGAERKRKVLPAEEERLISAGEYGDCVYIARAVNLTKIGYTTWLRKRWRDLKNDNPFAFLYSIIYRGDLALKRRLHETFSDKLLGGDWFELLEDDFDKIRDIVSGGANERQ